ncbi:hypothetical protein [Halioxenophilus aromaticivorans]|uniref:Uncharacterized protein n=1 Tax=Halioxenophilus aromaticivorans TaxID=1306992 RepID=A0AAV3U1J5_9ALTE
MNNITTAISALVLSALAALPSAVFAAGPSSGVVYSGDLQFNLGYGEEIAANEADQKLTAEGQTNLLNDGFKLVLPLDSMGTNTSTATLDPALMGAMGLSAEFVSADISQNFQPLAVGLSHTSLEANYLGDQFLSLKQWSPHLTGFIGENVSVRTDYTQSQKSLGGRPGRDANVDSLGANISWFINGAKAYFSLGAKYDTEDAVDPEHDFNANTIKLKLAKHFPFMTRSGIIKLGASYEQRLYKNGISELGEPREEGRTRYQAELELPLTQQLQLIVNAEFADHESNFAEAENTKYVTGAELNFSF